MKKAIVILLILIAASCSEADTTTTTVEAQPVNHNLLKDSQRCMRVGSSHHDPTIYNLEHVGYELDYTSGVWYFDGVEIGRAEFEDEAFDACGPTRIISIMEKFQDDIIAAGGTPFGEGK